MTDLELHEKFKDISSPYIALTTFNGACKAGDMETIRYLTKSEDYKNLVHPYLGMGFVNAAHLDQLDVIKYLLTEPGLTINVPISFDDNDALIGAATNGHINTVKYLLTSPDLKQKANINAQGDKALCRAVFREQKEVVDYLLYSPELKKHADLNSAFITGIKVGNIEIVEKFYKSFPTLNSYSKDDVSFIIAYEQQDLEKLKDLIFVQNIPKTKNIDKQLMDNYNPKVEQWFELRDVNKGLNEELPYNQTSEKKNKL